MYELTHTTISDERAEDALYEFLLEDICEYPPLDFDRKWYSHETKTYLPEIASSFSKSLESIEPEWKVYFAFSGSAERVGFFVICGRGVTHPVEVTTSASDLIYVGDTPVFIGHPGAGHAITQALAKMIAKLIPV